jgi:hypothetical protein
MDFIVRGVTTAHEFCHEDGDNGNGADGDNGNGADGDNGITQRNGATETKMDLYKQPPFLCVSV